ncbi:MAG: hypothetical protein ACFFDN_10135 [Candidatus Hodarchaeota archaeon]
MTKIDHDFIVYVFQMECYKCKKLTPVIYPHMEDINTGYSMWIWDTLEILMTKIRDAKTKYPLIKRVFSKTLGQNTYANTCKYCGAHIGGWFVQDEWVINANNPNYLQIDNYKVILTESDIKKYFEDEVKEPEREIPSLKKKRNLQTLNNKERNKGQKKINDFFT